MSAHLPNMWNFYISKAQDTKIHAIEFWECVVKLLLYHLFQFSNQ